MAETSIADSPREQRDFVARLYPAAFPDEDLVPLVNALLNDSQATLSLIAERDGQIVGHVLFTYGRVEGCTVDVALLAPLAVSPDSQGQGIGSRLVHEGLQRLQAGGVAWVFVLGDPAFYGRLGFTQERKVDPPYALPDEWQAAWQSQRLEYDAPSLSGRLILPDAWMQRALWAP